MAFFEKLFSGLSKSRQEIDDNLSEVFDRDSIDEDLYDDLEELLILSDIGVKATQDIIDGLKRDEYYEHIRKPKKLGMHMVNKVKEAMSVCAADYEFETKRSVVLVVGVNGVGKTTTIGKLSHRYIGQGKKVMIAAADTFRAAAQEQLKAWADRSGAYLITGKDGQDPSSVVYDAVNAARSRGADILFIDTAGRLNNKKNLMEELAKMNRIVDREYPDAYKETLIVLDAATGQNALSQAREFAEVTDVSGVVLTKLDGTSKGGIAIAIQSELSIPVKFIGVGEGIDDLEKFDADDYVKALFYKEDTVEDADEEDREQ
ncbi:MAG: signal recognition particle-docking protein FtsY [Lachnospiraceae bacterium]|nr:signal recognition particle-docking protein FtsY [Lachnospiraceae bacterium]MBR4573833.1 signal recognition particle-docking protein FtsY [Lachnospiraceae bacterium]